MRARGRIHSREMGLDAIAQELAVFAGLSAAERRELAELTSVMRLADGAAVADPELVGSCGFGVISGGVRLVWDSGEVLTRGPGQAFWLVRDRAGRMFARLEASGETALARWPVRSLAWHPGLVASLGLDLGALAERPVPASGPLPKPAAPPLRRAFPAAEAGRAWLLGIGLALVLLALLAWAFVR